MSRAGNRGRLVWAGVLIGAAAVAGLVLTGRPSGGEAETDPVPRPESGQRIRVEVLNQGGIPGAARDATLHLRDGGFDVVDFGNATPFDRDTSVVYDRVGRVDIAEAVADVLGIDNVRSAPDPNLYVEVSVMLGRDWGGAVRMDTPTAARRPWWDPRGWLRR